MKRRRIAAGAWMRRIAMQFVLIATALLTFGLLTGSGAEPDQPRQFELRAESNAFWNLLDRDAKLTKVGGGFGFTEGPVWDPKGFLYVSDEEQNKIYRLTLDGRKEELISLGDPDGNTYDRAHRLIDCASVLRAIIAITPDGHYKILADKFEGKRLNSPNDVIIGPDGAIYFTDPTLDLVKGEKQEIAFQGVYRLGAKGDLRLLTKDLTHHIRQSLYPGERGEEAIRQLILDGKRLTLSAEAHEMGETHERILVWEHIEP